MKTTMLLFAALAFGAGVVGAAADDLKVAATLEPREIRFGEVAELSVTVSSERPPDPVPVPAVDGLDFEGLGRSSSYRVVNGEVSASTTLHVRVTALRAGSFTIPAIAVSAGGRTGTSEPVVLNVVAGPAPRAASPSARGGTDAPRDRAFLEVTPANGDLYVGERVPVEIRACFRAGQRAAIRSMPRLTGDAFTLETTDGEPVRSELSIDGEPYVALTWEGALSAVKEGDHPFDASLDATLVLPYDRAHPRRRSLFDSDPFGDDFFGSAFDSFFDAGREQEVTLRAGPQTLHVKPLPAEGRPAGFTGAVGSFRLGVTAAPTVVAAGEPITLTTTVEGEGNFARVSAPVFPSAPGWKTYPAKAGFAPVDSSGAAGTKTFEQPVVPLGSNVTGIPPLSFSYFDPSAGAYVTRSTDPIPVEVKGAAAAGPVPPASAPGAPSLQRAGGRVVRDLRPMWEHPWFRYVGLAFLAALGVAVAVVRTRGRGPRPVSVRAIRQETDRAIAQSDARAFFAACRAAFQQRLALRWGCAAGSITLEEVRQRGAGEGIAAIFEAADSVAYSGRGATQEEMRVVQQRVLAEIAALGGKR